MKSETCLTVADGSLHQPTSWGYAATSQIFRDKNAGFDNSSEYLAGANYYLTNSRNHRLNVQVIDVNDWPVSSTFGYYVGGQNGTTYSAAVSVFF